MKKKFVVALVAAMSLTVAGTGTVFAMDKVSTIASEKEHVHGDNCEWIVDKEAWDETVHHPAEYKTVHHPAEYKTVHHPAEYREEEVYVVDKEAWDEKVKNPAKDVYEIKVQCNGCNAIFEKSADWEQHAMEMANKNDFTHMGWHDEEVLVEEGFDIIHHPEEGHTEIQKVLVKEAWDEQVLVKDAWDEQVLVKEAWDEIVHHPEEGHWVCNGEPQKPEQKPENPDQKPEQPENPDQKPEQPENPDQKPEQPENPDQKPEQPENPDQKPEQPENPDVETPETPDAENPATPEQKPEAPTTPEANKENVQTQETETKKEGTSPKTGDTSSALPVAGAGLASLGVALATILKKRK